MPTVEELAGVQPENQVPPAAPPEPVPGPGLSEKVMELLSTETGEGDIKDYVAHPLNIWQSEGVAQIIRGITGLTGNSLRLAVVDVAFGYFRWKNERMKGVGTGA